FWLIKSEPADYSIAALRVEGRTVWDGVRNPTARKHLRAMQVGDQCLFYHSSCKQIGVVGLATVCRAHYADPADQAWAVVDVEYQDTYRQIISLDALKQHRDGALAGMALFKMSRLSVQPVS
ncbi:hypothetical protein EMIHUDRAFT_58527, partial [Emiliania huxleyi CCMP1516]|uniref:EVE domain-containing protein n=2 Tax=Emiliania huxleyi TaxID=2903 RepID=A0A0D3L0V0_EMIH1